MQLKYLELENIRSYLRQRVDFPQSTTLFAGDIGSGKSSILLAIEFALFGMLRGEISGSDILRHGKDIGHIELCFEVNGSQVVVRRNLKRNKNSVAQDTGWIEINGVRTHKTPQEIRALILEKLGYPKEYLTKNPIMYRYTVYTPQDNMKSIILEKPDDRVAILRRLFGIERYSIIRGNAQVAITELRAMKRESLAAASGLEERRQMREKAEGEKNRLGTGITSASARLQEMEGIVKNYEEQLDGMQNEIRSLSEAIRERASVEARISDRQRRNSEISRDLEQSVEALGRTKGMEEPSKPLKSEGEILNEKNAAKGSVGSCISRISVLKNDVRKLRSIMDRGECEFCGQKVASKEHFNVEIVAKEIELQNLQRSMEESESKLVELERAEKRLSEYRHTVVLYQRNADDRNNLEKRIDSLKKEILNNEEFIEEFSKRLQELKRSLERLPQLESQERNLHFLMKQAQDEKVNAASELASLKATLNSLEISIKQYAKEILAKEAALQRSRKLTEISSWTETIFIPMMESMEQTVMQTIKQEFNSMFQEWFSIMVSDEGIAVSVGSDFSPVIEQQGYETEYQNLSGGEKTSVALAYRLALNKIINSLVETATRDLIILDEPTDGFSYEQLDRIRDVLQKLNLKQMIIVSHEPKIDTFVDNVIRFYKEGHVSKAVAE